MMPLEKVSPVEIGNEDKVYKNEIMNYGNYIIEVQQQSQKFTREEMGFGFIGSWPMAMNQDYTILVNSVYEDIQIWYFSSDGQLNLKQTLKGHTDQVYSLYFSKKSNMFISGSWDKTIRIWQTNDQDQWIYTQTLEGHEDLITDIILDNEEDQLISCSNDKTIKIWMKQQDNQWKCVQTLIEHTGFVYFIKKFFLGI